MSLRYSTIIFICFSARSASYSFKSESLAISGGSMTGFGAGGSGGRAFRDFTSLGGRFELRLDYLG